MNKEFRELYDADIARYGGKSDYILRKFLRLFRHEQTAKTRFGRKWYHYRFTLMRYMLHIEMWAPTKIGKGLYVGHPFCIGVNPRATIGENCNIHKSASVGQENRGPRKGYPTIGNYVWLGMGSTIVGNVTIGNDVFALVKGDAEITITLPENATKEEVTQILYEYGLIEYDWVFAIYLDQYGDGEEVEFIAGEHTLNVSMNYSQLLIMLTTPFKEREVVTLTIPEGFTVDDIINLFVKNGVGTREGFVDAINNYPYKHEFVRLLDESGWDSDRVYRLEGYLYPDTYDFYTDTEEYLAINKLLNNFNAKVWVDWKTTYSVACLEKGYTLDDIVILSSMIEAEGKTAEDFEYISYVFHNRMTHKTDYPLLESDATIQYALELAGMDRIQDSSQIDKSFPSPYNTYTNEGLPPGAICNAGLDAILAAIYPSPPYDDNGDELNAFFFVSNDLGQTYYAATISGHLKNVERVKQENEALKAEKNEND